MCIARKLSTHKLRHCAISSMGKEEGREYCSICISWEPCTANLYLELGKRRQSPPKEWTAPDRTSSHINFALPTHFELHLGLNSTFERLN